MTVVQFRGKRDDGFGDVLDWKDENAVLSYLISDPSMIRRANLSLDCFHHPRHRAAYSAMLQLDSDGAAVDVLQVAKLMFPDATRPHDYFDAAVKLTIWPRVEPQWLDWYCKRLRELAYRRAMTEVDEQAARSYADADADPDAIEARRNQRRREIQERLYQPDTMTDPKDAVLRVVEAAMEGVQRMTTGFGVVDQCCGELTAGMVLTVLAKAGVGKSYFASNVIVNHLKRETDYGVAFASLEMSDTMTTKRIVKQYMEWTDAVFERNCASPTNRFVEDAQGRYCHIAIPRTTLAHIEQHLDRWQERHERPIRLLVIDFLQYIKPKPSDGKNLYEQTGNVTRDLKELAKRRNALVLVLSQVRRDAQNSEEAGFRCPSIESARDSGTIEENADVLLGLWRDKMRPDVLYVRGLKVREGARDMRAELRFDWTTGRIAEVWDERR